MRLTKLKGFQMVRILVSMFVVLLLASCGSEPLKPPSKDDSTTIRIETNDTGKAEVYKDEGLEGIEAFKARRHITLED